MRTLLCFLLLGPPIGLQALVVWGTLWMALRTAFRIGGESLYEGLSLELGQALAIAVLGLPLAYAFGLPAALVAGAAVAGLELSRPAGLSGWQAAAIGLGVGALYSLPFLASNRASPPEALTDLSLFLTICLVPTLACWRLSRRWRPAPRPSGDGE